METTIRKSVRQQTADQIPQVIATALNWMQTRYQGTNFANVDFIFSASYNRSRYFRNEKQDAKYKTPMVCISTRAKLCLYDKPSLGIKKRVLFVGSDVQMICALIHELTHHWQYETGQKTKGELATTANELQYLKDFHPHYYRKITRTK